MYTGIVQELGRIERVDRSADGARLTVAASLADELREGDSVAVSGVCLTAVSVNDGHFQAQAMQETLSRSSLAHATAGTAVNLELPLRPSDRLGGHIVQGHVDGLGTVIATRDDGFAREIEIEAAQALLRYVVEKGSVAVDGVSLTVAGLGERSFTVSLIPETLGRTTLGRLREGARVNLEVDLVAKYVERLSTR